MKTCSKCNKEKDNLDFYRDKLFKDGFAKICKFCRKKQQAKWIEKNRDRYNATMRKYNAKNYHRLRLMRYKITPEIYAKMLLDQKGVCAICKNLPTGKMPLAIDHCHSSKKVRGLLCFGCNRAIAILDKPELLDRAKSYLSGQ